MKLNYLILLFYGTLICCSSLKNNNNLNNCSNEKIIINNDKKFFMPSKDSLFLNIALMTRFNDTLIVKCDDNIIVKDFFFTDFSTSYTGKTFIYYFEKKKSKTIKLTIIDVSNKICLNVKIPKISTSVYIYHLKNEWTLNLTNEKMLLE